MKDDEKEDKRRKLESMKDAMRGLKDEDSER